PLLGRLHCPPDIVDRCRNVYPLPGRETVAGYQADRGGYAAIYETRNYKRFRMLIVAAVKYKYAVAGTVVALFVTAVFAMGRVEQQFFPNSDRTELLIDVTLPQGSSIETTSASVKKLEDWLHN